MFGSIKRQPRRRMVKAGIAAAAAVAAGGAIFASQAGAASVTTSNLPTLMSTNVMLKVPHGTTCVVVENYFHDGLRVVIKRKTQVYGFRALHWKSSAWNSIGSYLVGFDSVRVFALKTPGSCPKNAESLNLPSDQGSEFFVTAPRGSWPDDWFDASHTRLIRKH